MGPIRAVPLTQPPSRGPARRGAGAAGVPGTEPPAVASAQGLEQLPAGRSAWLRTESRAAAAGTPAPAAPRSGTESAAEKRSVARRVVDENLLQTATRQRNRMSSSLNTYL